LQKYNGWFPREVEIRLTWNCDANCVMCGLRHYLKDCSSEYKTTVPISRMLAVINELANNGCESIIFSGGEVTLLPYLPELVKQASSKGIAVHINTHAGRLTKQLCNDLIDSGLAGMMISIDAPNAAIHDQIRNLPGLFDRAKKNIDYLRTLCPTQADLFLLINTVIMKPNFRSLPKMVEWAAGIQIPELTFSPLSIDNDWDDWADSSRANSLKLSSEDEFLLEHKILPEVLSLASQHKVTVRIPANISTTGKVSLYHEFFNDKPVNCAISSYHTVINVNGDVLPCCYANAGVHTIGNICNSSFMDIWHGEGYKKFRQSCFPAEFDMCKSCSQHRNENELIERWFKREEGNYSHVTKIDKYN